MTKKNYSILAGVFSILAIFPLLVGLTKWGNPIYVAVINVSIFLPLIFGVLGLIFALIGIKGKVKVGLILLNVFGICLSLFLLFVAFFGFQEP